MMDEVMLQIGRVFTCLIDKVGDRNVETVAFSYRSSFLSSAGTEAKVFLLLLIRLATSNDTVFRTILSAQQIKFHDEMMI